MSTAPSSNAGRRSPFLLGAPALPEGGNFALKGVGISPLGVDVLQGKIDGWHRYLIELTRDSSIADVALYSYEYPSVIRNKRTELAPFELADICGIHPVEDFWVFSEYILGISKEAAGLSRKSYEPAVVATAIGESVRFRCAFALSSRGFFATMRRIKETVPDPDSILLPRSATERVMALRSNGVEKPGGLVLAVGATGSGKSTTLASLLKQRAKLVPGERVIMIEDPIEYEFPHSINGTTYIQRECGKHVFFDAPEGRMHESDGPYAVGLREALRMAPDVIVVGEIREPSTAAVALRASLTGHVVMASMHAQDAKTAFEMFAGLLPPTDYYRRSLALAVRVIIAQQLVPKKQSAGVCAVHEVYFSTQSIEHHLAKGDYSAVPPHIDQGRARGMLTFDESFRKRRDEGLL